MGNCFVSPPPAIFVDCRHHELETKILTVLVLMAFLTSVNFALWITVGRGEWNDSAGS